MLGRNTSCAPRERGFVRRRARIRAKMSSRLRRPPPWRRDRSDRTARDVVQGLLDRRKEPCPRRLELSGIESQRRTVEPVVGPAIVAGRRPVVGEKIHRCVRCSFSLPRMPKPSARWLRRWNGQRGSLVCDAHRLAETHERRLSSTPLRIRTRSSVSDGIQEYPLPPSPTGLPGPPSSSWKPSRNNVRTGCKRRGLCGVRRNQTWENRRPCRRRRCVSPNGALLRSTASCRCTCRHPRHGLVRCGVTATGGNAEETALTERNSERFASSAGDRSAQRTSFDQHDDQPDRVARFRRGARRGHVAGDHRRLAFHMRHLQGFVGHQKIAWHPVQEKESDCRPGQLADRSRSSPAFPLPAPSNQLDMIDVCRAVRPWYARGSGEIAASFSSNFTEGTAPFSSDSRQGGQDAARRAAIVERRLHGWHKERGVRVPCKVARNHAGPSVTAFPFFSVAVPCGPFLARS